VATAHSTVQALPFIVFSDEFMLIFASRQHGTGGMSWSRTAYFSFLEKVKIPVETQLHGGWYLMNISCRANNKGRIAAKRGKKSLQLRRIDS
jgi:hypothetical protein